MRDKSNDELAELDWHYVARDPEEKNDGDLQAEYLIDLAERFVKSCEKFAHSFSLKSF